MESPFPAPGKLIKVKTFLPGAGNEVRAVNRNTFHTLCEPCSSHELHLKCFITFFFFGGVSGHRVEAAQRLQTRTREL